MSTTLTLAFAAALAASVPLAAAPAPAATTMVAAPALASDEFPADWFIRQGAAAAKHKAMQGKPAPKLKLKGLLGDEKQLEPLREKDPLKALRGKVVVIDFWATWCGPCRRAIPENIAMVRELGDKGLAFIGVHDPENGHESMKQVASEAGVNYPLAIDGGGSVKAWNVSFWPNYAVVDRSGTLRAIGLQPDAVRRVVDKLLEEPAPAEKAGSDDRASKNPGDDGTGEAAAEPKEAATRHKKPLDPALREGDQRRRAALAKFDLCPEAPALDVKEWMNHASAGNPSSLADLKGKIVVIDFWATWCAPCIRKIPEMNALSRKYADKGVVVVGVCHKDGGEKMAATAKSNAIEYPICLDFAGKTNALYLVDGYPDFYIVDRDGRVRGADIGNGNVEAAIVALLGED
ncbi:MAG: TlpA family protein disulfide reductase [Planctomycetota bacterium]